MDASRRQAWVRAALLLGVVYFLIGRVFALPVKHVRVWRLAAWLVSGGAYAAHIWYEHFRLRNSPRLTAVPVAVAVVTAASFLPSPVGGSLRSHSVGFARSLARALGGCIP